ncbi:hypothetical protein ACFRAQ_16525 [Nocardia sp. NPDC056611]|uniref:hypothetical protein n=1 Tax=Nocardia sp. NPDC056611 TaxID=3345877 RepID=UPI00366D1769
MGIRQGHLGADDHHDGKHDSFTPPGDDAAFTGRYDHRVLEVGHNVPAEDLDGFGRPVNRRSLARAARATGQG